MRAEIVAVGTELLLGQIQNGNATFISQVLAGIGVDVMYHTVVGDNEERIADSLTLALSRCDVLLITGGLGPTQDDLTREAIARATGRPLQRSRELEDGLRERFARFGRPMAQSNLRQADLPKGARAIPNPRGTAPGLAVEHKGKWIFAMPGVPSEMEFMLKEHIVPELVAAAGGGVVLSRLIGVAGIPESEIAERLEDVVARLDEERTATIAFLPNAGEVRIRITAKGASEQIAQTLIDPVEESIREVLGIAVFGVGEESLEQSISKLLLAKKLTLAIAESLTAGQVSSRLVDVPGASEFFRAGYVCYSLEAKADLGVPRDVLENHGAVSEQTAVAMADAARRKAGVDLGISTTGEAGPDAQAAEIGTIFVALAWEGGSVFRGFRAPGERAAVRRWATNGALNLLRLYLLDQDL